MIPNLTTVFRAFAGIEMIYCRERIFSAAAAIICILPCIAAAQQQSTQPSPAGRRLAVTFDDLPLVRVPDLHEARGVTGRLLETIRRYRMPAIGFVNERKLGETAIDTGRVALLRRWLEAGLELGNHTWSHPSFFNTPLADYREDVMKGEQLTRPLMEAVGAQLRYFRHPFLNTGPDPETKAAFERFLAEHGYIVAPVTIDNAEWLYALAYDRAFEAADSMMMVKVGQDYLRYMEEIFAFYEDLSLQLLGREPAQILLLHANRLNSDYLGHLANRMISRGYRFISLETALRDPAYSLPDTYTGQEGLSWLLRWWVSEGRAPLEEPDPPAWVLGIAYPERS